MTQDVKGETPPVSPPVTITTDAESEAEGTRCQWFMSDMKFCDKVKKYVKCDGNVRKCPF